ncbi:phosphodiester glycosidase family protein [bacterium]|nr:phosphodiester glycosidase family protein [bacterium]
MFDKIDFLRKKTPPPLPPGAKPFDQGAIEKILGTRCEKDSFVIVEDTRRFLAPGVSWRRRRLGWSDHFTGEDMGLCLNELRVESGFPAKLQPSIAMAYPGLLDIDAIEYAYWQTHWAAGALRGQSPGEKESRLFVNMRALTCSKSGAPRGPWEDLEALQLSVDSGEWNDDLLDLIPTMQPSLRRFNGSQLEVARYLPAYPPSWSVQADANVLAATNGGYFLNFPEEYEDDLSALHQPIGALYADGMLHMPPWIERPCAVEWRDGVRRIEVLGPQNLTMCVNDNGVFQLVSGIQEPEAAATVWREFDGPMPSVEPGEPVVDLVFSGTGLAKVAAPGTAHPPIGGAIVRLMGSLAAPWQEWLDDPGRAPFPKWELRLITSRDMALDWVMASGPKLLSDGRVLDADALLSPWAAGEFRPNGPPPSRYPYDADRTRGPRTAIGLTTSEDWVITVIDGRTDMAHSVGLTLCELARLMHHLGCYHSMNLDGGGSSVMAIEGISQLDQLRPGIASSVTNIPSDPGSRERILPVALTVVSNPGG